MMPLPFRIVEKRIKRPDCTLLTVKPIDATCLCAFQPGQFYMLYVFGHGEVPISVSGNPACHGSLDFTIKNVGSVTSALCALEKGALLGLRGPFGSVWPLEGSKGRDIILMAGGLGLVPLRAVIYQLISLRDRYGKISLLYGARSPVSLLFEEELEAWGAHMHVAVTVDSAEGGWSGPVGFVTNLLKDVKIDGDNTTAMICGPEVMIRSSAAALRGRGLSTAQVHVAMERNMKCAIGFCGHCQYGPYFTCKDGPVFSLEQVGHLLQIRDI